MATTYGAPTNLDLSACSVTATGGTTSQTLADLGKAVGDNATAVATAQTDASAASAAAATAQTNAAAAAASASAALTAANTAQTAATAAQTTANAAMPSNLAGKPHGFVFTDANNNAYIPTNIDGRTAALEFNYGVTATNAQSHIVHSLYQTTAHWWCITDSDNATAFTLAGFGRLRPNTDGESDLGMAATAFNNIYSKTAVQVTSDATQKTVIGSLGDTSYTDGQKLASALFGLDTTMFQLNASIAAKGSANARLHAGFIAQQVEAAITAAGLDPAKYALWTNSPVSETTEVDTGKKDADGNAVTELVSTLKKDANGNQVYTQMLRYDQILCVLFEACKAKIAAQESALSALTTRVAALEDKAGA